MPMIKQQPELGDIVKVIKGPYKGFVGAVDEFIGNNLVTIVSTNSDIIRFVNCKLGNLTFFKEDEI
jgi:transcription antitermination factor NusG